MTNSDLIRQLVNSEYLKTPDIIKAFKKIDRVNFVPKDFVVQAYQNIPLPIGLGQTISQPLTVAFMLELLELKKGDRVLEIGFGSGWQTSLIAEIIGLKGRIFAIERIKNLFDLGKANIEKYNFFKKGVVSLYCQDGSIGLEKEAPFDKIVSAASIEYQGKPARHQLRYQAFAGGKFLEAVPAAWKKQVKVGGIIVSPINYSVFRFRKLADDKFETEEYPGFAFVPLVKN